MRHGGACCHGVGSGAGGRRDDDAIALNGCYEVVVDPQVQVGEEGGRTAADDDLVERERGLVAVLADGERVVTAVGERVGAPEAVAEQERHVASEDRLDVLLVLLEVEGTEEA